MSTTQDSSVQAAPTPAPKKQIRISTVIQMLKDGKDRDQIKAELSLTPAEARAVFSHKDVIRKKVRKPVELGIEIIEDLEEESVVTDTPQEEVVLPQTSEELPIEAEPTTETIAPEPQAEAPAPFMAAFATPATPAAPAPQPAVSGWE